MLNILRDGVKESLLLKVFLLGMLGMALGGLILLDVGSYFRDGLGQSSLARVGEQKIDVIEFDRRARNILDREGIPTDIAYNMGRMDTILDAMIFEIIMENTADDFDIVISNGQIEQELQRYISQYDDGTGRSQKELLDIFLAQRQMSESQLITEVKKHLRLTLISDMLSTPSTLISDLTAQALKRRQSEKRDISVLKVPFSHIDRIDPPSDEDLMAFYEENKSLYSIPEKRSIKFFKIDTTAFENNVQINDEILKQIYDERSGDFEIAERRYIEQAILRTEKEAQEVYAHVQDAKKSLKDAVAAVTDDSLAYRPEDYFEEDGLLDSLKEPVFQSEIGTVTEPVESPLGWHILKINKVEESYIQPFEEVKSQIEEEYKEDQIVSQLITLVEAVEDDIFSGAKIDQIAEKNNLSLITIKDIPQDDTEAAVKLFTPHQIRNIEMIVNETFLAEANIPTDLVEIDTDVFTVIEVTDITPESSKPFEDVKEDVKLSWLARERNNKVRDLVRDTADRINEGTLTLRDFANQEKLPLVEYKGHSLNDELKGPLTSEVVTRVFAETKIGRVDYAEIEDGFVFYKTKEIFFDAEGDTETDEQASLMTQKIQLRNPLSTGTVETFFAYQKEKEDVLTNTRLLRDMYAPEDNTSF